VPVAHREGIVSASLSDDGEWLITTSFDAYAILSEVDSRRELARFSGQFIGFSMGAFSPDRTRVALIGMDGSLSIWNTDGQRLASFQAHPDYARSPRWSQRGETIATRGNDGLRIWRAPAFNEIRMSEESRYGQVMQTSQRRATK
jgi:WD40 repeat protein